MTKEEKAKAYDEALERAKCEIDTKGIGDTVDLCKHLFPQLHESENERIRKAIKCYVEDMPDTYGFAHGIGKKEMLSYLEKQKEEEGYEAIPVKSTLEYKLGFADGRDYEKQKYQKPAEWNANDKAFIKDCARILDENFYTESAERLLSMFPVKPAEWSEEDKEWLSEVYFAIDHSMYSNDERQAMKKYIDSLRPSWKPSEEQMDALESAQLMYAHGFERRDIAGVLESLYNDLKGLM